MVEFLTMCTDCQDTNDAGPLDSSPLTINTTTTTRQVSQVVLHAQGSHSLECRGLHRKSVENGVQKSIAVFTLHFKPD
jgi:hypothetical protein